LATSQERVAFAILMKVHVLRSAVNDLTKARKFYDRQEEGIGDYFFDSLFSEIDSLVLFGGIHSVHFGFNRLLAKRFPYAIYYKVCDGEVIDFSCS
jgi:hypothetical protein